MVKKQCLILTSPKKREEKRTNDIHQYPVSDIIG